jgi:hypothetical protein
MPRGGKQLGAGRPAGRKNNKTVRLEDMRKAAQEAFMAEVAPKIKDLSTTLVKYGLAGNVQALSLAFDRVLGKVPDRVQGTGEKPQPILIQHNVFLHQSDRENRESDQEAEDNSGGDGSEQNSLNSNLIDNLRSAGQNPDSDLDSLRELSPPEPGSDEGLSSNSQNP